MSIFTRSVSTNRPWRDVDVPSAVSRVPSMLTDEERQYLIWTAAAHKGWGAVVDLGPWVGGSSAALAHGLRVKGAAAKVHSYDLFLWEPDYMERYLPTGLPAGADFMPIFERETADYAPWIRAERMDLCSGQWRGGAIEILFVDAAKTWRLLNTILRVFGPSLVPGKSRIVLQDFRVPYAYWLPLVFDSRPDLWREIESVESGTTVTFELLKPLDGPGGLHAEYDDACFPAAVVRHLLTRRISATVDDHAPVERAGREHGDRAAFALAMYRAMLRVGEAADIAEAESTFRDLCRHMGSWSSDELVTMQDMTAGELMCEAQEDLQHGRLMTAHECAERCLTYCGLHSAAWMVKGRVAQLDGAVERALEAFDRALEVDAEDPSFARLFRAESLIRLGRYEQANADTMFHLDRSSRPDIVRWGMELLESCWTAAADLQMAVSGIGRLRPRFADNADFLCLESLVASHSGDVARARELLGRALEIAPKHEGAARLAAAQKP